MKTIEELTIKQLRELIGKKIEYQYFCNGYEEKLPNNILEIESVRIHDDLIGIKTTIDENDEFIKMDDEEFEDFINGKIYNFDCKIEDDNIEQWFKLLIEEKNENINN